jgi:protein-S-isoprenylcysteine O-methyltransferase Ste14
MPAALALEGAIAIAGLRLFLGRSGLSRARKISLVALTLLILVLTVAGMTVAPAPPSIVAMAATSLATIGLTAALFAWIGRPAATNRQVADR